MKQYKKQVCNGSITIFLALSLTLIISVIFSTVESARRIAVSSYLEGVTATCMDSVFSDYCTQLWEDYHVFAVVSDNKDFRNNLVSYIKRNLDLNDNLLENRCSFLKSTLDTVTINDFSNFTDNYGETFIHQVLAYMQYREITNVADYLLSSSDVEYDPFELADLANGDLSAEAFEALDLGPLVDMVEAANKEMVDEDCKTDIDISETFTLDSLKNIQHIFNDMLIHYLVESPSDISYKMIDRKGFPSTYINISGEHQTITYNELDRFLFCEYLVEHFSSYTTPVKDSGLDYQLEYILCGNRSDEFNLTDTAKELVILRFGFNIVHILSDQEKMNTLASIAETTAFIPALPIIIESLLICIWALAEAVIDVRDLLAGEEIPLLKASDDWSLSIENMLELDYETEGAKRTSPGLSYNKYLEILLFSKDIHTLSINTLDLIQLDFVSNINDTFSITNCIIGASCDFKYKSKDIFSTVNFYHTTYFAPIYTFTHNYYYR